MCFNLLRAEWALISSTLFLGFCTLHTFPSATQTPPQTHTHYKLSPPLLPTHTHPHTHTQHTSFPEMTTSSHPSSQSRPVRGNTIWHHGFRRTGLHSSRQRQHYACA